MRKILFLATLLGLLSTNLTAQTYYPVTHMSGSATINGQNVTVSAINPPNLGPIYYCGVGPYYPGQRPVTGLPAQNGFRYVFSSGATHVRITMADIHTSDTMQFSVNGTPYVLTAGDISAYAGSCTAPNTPVITPSGALTSSTGVGTGAGATIVLQIPPTLMTDVRVEQVGSGASDGVVYSFEFAVDSCTQKLTVTSNNPCAGRKLQLDATPFPGATFTWFGPQSFTAPNAPTVFRNPILVNQGGFYGVTVQWGACTFKDSVDVNVSTKPTPALPFVNILAGANPICKNMDLTLESVSTGAAGIQYYWYGPGLPVTNIQDLTIPGIQPSQAGFYYTYAIGTGGCVSDTLPYNVQLLPDVTAGMNVTWAYGCTQDTVTVTNQSNGQNKNYLYFSPVNGGVTQQTLVDSSANVIHIIYKPNTPRDTIPDTIDIKTVVTNGTCSDSVTQRVIFNHPLRADFTVSDDTICQGTQITFNNKTSAATGPTHTYLWDFKTGDTAQTYSTQYTYENFGVYNATLVVTDYLGCKDSAQKLIFVDSTGAIHFNVSDSVVCSGDQIRFEGIYEKFGTVSTRWDFGDGTTVVNTATPQHAYEAGLYTVRFTNFNRVCPDTFAEREMTVFAYPGLNIGKDTSICPNGKPIILRDIVNMANPLAQYHWHLPTNDTTPSIYVRHPGVYAVSVNVDGCVTTDSITVFKNCYINIPNSFTPGAGTNNYFMPRQLLSSGVKKFNMVIYNRWGQQVFETSVADGRGWDGNFNGEPQPLGVYVYQVSVTFENGASENYTGNVTLLR